MAKFQVKLSGEWKDYDAQQDKILKRAYLAGFPNARYKFGKFNYTIDFGNMHQINAATGKQRDIRAPYKWKQPAAPIVPKGPTTCITVPEGAAGRTIQVPNPKVRGQMISVEVPANAKAGQAMLVPIPDAPAYSGGGGAPPPSAPMPEAAGGKDKDGGYSTGAKVAMGVGGVAAAGGVVAGAVLGAHIADVGFDAAMADVGDGAAAAGDGIADVAGDAGDWAAGAADDAADWIGDAADSAGDFIMDLF